MEPPVGGGSYGVNAYEFPNQGMSRPWAHFDRSIAPITTNDLHLNRDIPFTRDKVAVIGRDSHDSESPRTMMRPAGSPKNLDVQVGRTQLRADGRDGVQTDIALRDAQGQLLPDHNLPVTVHVEDDDPLGMDHGKPENQSLYRSGCRITFGGMTCAIVREPPGCRVQR